MINRLLQISALCGLLLLPFVALEGKPPEIDAKAVTVKLKEIMRAHASYKSLTPELVKRALNNYLDEIDPNKTYFLESDIHKWLNPSEETLLKVLKGYGNSDFHEFFLIQNQMETAIERRRLLDKKIDLNDLPKNVKPEEFKNMKWVKTTEDLLDRIRRIKALQLETAAKLHETLEEKTLQRIAKRQATYEEEFLEKDPLAKERYIYSKILKATASALDTHTAYFTPAEANQFMISMQQRLFGIGAQLRDDLNGFTMVKLIEGGPAANSKELKVKDRIVAVDGEPVVGMDILDAVELIRGEENTPVTLTVIREMPSEDGTTHEEQLTVSVIRGEVVIKEARFEASFEPFGDGVIAYLRLYSFYQDQDNASATDLARELEKLKKEHNVKGVILDLRSNTGGLLTQAVAVAGLFITKGVVVSIKDDAGKVQHLRDLDGKVVWDGPLIVMVNRASASASEIVAQTLQDYGRALIVGDEHTYGKGSYQTFTLNAARKGGVNPEGEYKVSRGRYYTVSGKTPQLRGVMSDVVVPGALSEMEIGEEFAKYPLESDQIPDSFDDDLSDIPFFQRERIGALYRYNLQKKLTAYTQFLDQLRGNSGKRLEKDKNYQNFLKELKKKDKDVEGDDEASEFGQNDLQLGEGYNIMKDLILLDSPDARTVKSP